MLSLRLGCLWLALAALAAMSDPRPAGAGGIAPADASDTIEVARPDSLTRMLFFQRDLRFPYMATDDDPDDNGIPNYMDDPRYLAQPCSPRRSTKSRAYVYPRTVWRGTPVRIFIVTNEAPRGVRMRVRYGRAYDYGDNVHPIRSHKGILLFWWWPDMYNHGRFEVQILMPSDTLCASVTVR